MSPRPKAVAIMSEETENKPTQAPSAPFRRRRPSRRRSGRRNNAERGPGAFNESDNDNPGHRGAPDVLEEDASQESQRRRAGRRGIWLRHAASLAKTDLPRNPTGHKAVCRTATNRLANRNTAKASSRFPAKALVFCATRNATSSRHHRTFSSRRKSCGASNSATECGSTARPAAAIAARN